MMRKGQWQNIFEILAEIKSGYYEVSREARRAVDDPAFRMEKFPTFTRQEMKLHYEVMWGRHERITEDIRALKEVRDYYLGEK
tara:strand:+ start:163 stop:411 length:249 start_codon:yes stop_codon:yes gene_type:complete